MPTQKNEINAVNNQNRTSLTDQQGLDHKNAIDADSPLSYPTSKPDSPRKIATIANKPIPSNN